MCVRDNREQDASPLFSAQHPDFRSTFQTQTPSKFLLQQHCLKMASTKKIKVGPIHTTLYVNLRLLMSSHSHSNILADVLTEDLFVLPNSNKKASNEVIFFLLKVWDKAKCSEKFKFCWPVLDRKQESQFQRAACGLMQEIKAAHPEARLPTVSLALFLQPGGDKYCIFLLRLTTFLLSSTLEETELVTRPLPKKGENLADTKDLFKTLAESSFTHAVEACAGSEASLLGADNFRQKMKDWWLSWEESEETAIVNFKNEVLKLDLSNDLSSLLISNPENVGEFRDIVFKLKSTITDTLNRLEGKQNGQVRIFAATSPDKEVPPLKDGLGKNFNTAKKKVLKSLTELKLILDLAERQEGWPLHSVAAQLKEKLQDGQPADIIKQLEERLGAVKGTEVKHTKRTSFVPSPAVTIIPCKLRQVPVTPLSAFENATPFPFKPTCGPTRGEQESVESILLRWHQPKSRHSTVPKVPQHEATKSPIYQTSPLCSTTSPSFPCRQPLPVIKESPKSPTFAYSPRNTKIEIQVPQFDLTPPSEALAAPRKRGRRSFFDTSDDDIPFGEISLLELAELHLTLSPDSGSPEPPQFETAIEKPPAAQPESVDVKPDIQSLVARLQAIKDRSKAVPYVFVKSELKSP